MVGSEKGAGCIGRHDTYQWGYGQQMKSIYERAENRVYKTLQGLL